MCNYSFLPETISYEDFLIYSNEIFERMDEISHEPQLKSAFSDYLEISDRLWESYILLEQNDKYQIELKFMDVIKNKPLIINNPEIINTLLLIIPRLGLSVLFKFLLNNKNRITNSVVLTELSRSEKEYGDTVDDPYYGMKGNFDVK